jgi:predicted CXXCH cytochrome family protein
MPKKKRNGSKSAPVPASGLPEPATKPHQRDYAIRFLLSGILISACLLGLTLYRYNRNHSSKISAANEYVDSATCAQCHQNIAESFGHTGMSRSFYSPSPENMPEDFAVRNKIFNKASGDYYTMIRRGNEYYQRRHQMGFDGKETNIMEERIDYVIGSGDQARSFLHRNSQGMLIELPVTWYSEANGFWDMTPGYEFANQKDFHGRVSKDCIFCHDAYPSADANARDAREEAAFPSALPMGIDCQRCHGPGGEHEKAARSSVSADSLVRSTIVNPATLSRDRQLEICMECHLSTSASQDSNVSLRYNRSVFSYRPGQPLSDYKLYFDSGRSQDASGFEIPDAAYRLRMSRCFKQSQMTCLTCHDPHAESHGKQREAEQLQVCEGCHRDVKHDGTLPKSETCLSCHMPKRRGEFAVHVVLTDHYIQRQKPMRDLLKPILPKEIAASSNGPLAPYYPEKLRDDGEDQLYLSMATCKNAVNLQCASGLETLIKRYAPTEAKFYAALGDAYSRAGNQAQAIAWFDEALRRNPTDLAILGKMVDSLIDANQLDRAQQLLESAEGKASPSVELLANLGNIYARQGQLRKADETLHQVLSIDPELAQSYNLLGMVPEQEGNYAEAVRLYREAIRLRPDLAEAHNNLARVLVASNQYKEAEFEFKQAISAAPGFAEAHHNFGLFLVATKQAPQSEAELGEAVRLDAGNAIFHSDLADLLTERGKEAEAIREYREALRLNPNLNSANIGLGMALVHQGNVMDGKAYCRAGLRSSDKSLVELANSCLRR